ncbi:MAG TPA: transcriptional regulator FilR1 domain-containing protein, partial [Methanomassiliicoccales archaeon]
ADRRRIIEELQTQHLKLNEVAKKLDIAPTEAFRQLQKLTEAGLLEKTVEGKFCSTPYSRLVMESSATMDFLSKHREYFLDHDTSLIPPQFRIRFGELSKTVLRSEAVVNINTATLVLRDSEKRIDVMAEQHMEHNGQILRQKSLDGVKVRSLLQGNMIETIEEEPIVTRSWERRVIPRICAIIVLTEKIVGISLPKLDGKMDYKVLEGKDSESMKWASDLFEDQWNRARPWHP